MDIIVSGKHLDITPAIREYAQQKMAKLPRYFDRISLVEVVADKGRHPQDLEVEVIVHADRSHPFVTKVTRPDLYACIDEAVDKLERQLTDHKEKVRSHHHVSPKML